MLPATINKRALSVAFNKPLPKYFNQDEVERASERGITPGRLPGLVSVSIPLEYGCEGI